MCCHGWWTLSLRALHCHGWWTRALWPHGLLPEAMYLHGPWRLSLSLHLLGLQTVGELEHSCHAGDHHPPPEINIVFPSPEARLVHRLWRWQMLRLQAVTEPEHWCYSHVYQQLSPGFLENFRRQCLCRDHDWKSYRIWESWKIYQSLLITPSIEEVTNIVRPHLGWVRSELEYWGFFIRIRSRLMNWNFIYQSAL